MTYCFTYYLKLGRAANVKHHKFDPWPLNLKVKLLITMKVIMATSVVSFFSLLVNQIKSNNHSIILREILEISEIEYRYKQKKRSN